ncbi:MAG: hypothetical protein RIR79_4 [Pseudomonadota bacterium]|jgi:hemerythrin-like metal-binding protein
MTNTLLKTLQWSDELALNMPLMDQTHQEFIELLTAVQNADDANLLSAWQTLVEHTIHHFGREDRWMLETHFAASNCHTSQHTIVLDILRQGTEKGLEGDFSMIRQLATELVTWFPMHTDAMDAALAGHFQRIGFDPATGIIHKPEALPAAEIHGCAGDSCGDQ